MNKPNKNNKICCDCSGTITITLPPVSEFCPDDEITIEKVGSGTIVVVPHENETFVFNETDWLKQNNNND